MTAVLADDLRAFAGRKWPAMNHKWRKARLASLLGLSDRRIKSIYEAEQTARLRADEKAKITALIGQKEEANADADRAVAERLAELEAQVAFLVSALARETLAAEGRETGGALRRRAGESPSPARRREDA
ncbi:MAG: hypothetical protein P0Y65_05665 [Candidatus Devosia phytovorans]|uniref:Uncharacterized protein n=1 Tax=Candidatus Devosia phytovorans TaxID=3121372 RepID=A0AAJ5VWK4_9HYPH|nr:hypothetical protein [Devosia sp.]WEK05742.1 MAG: hypothetical protein P0Y65_05665 [Devosia sp.]